MTTHIETGNRIITCGEVSLVAWGNETEEGQRGTEPHFAVRIWMIGDEGDGPSVILTRDDASDFLARYRKYSVNPERSPEEMLDDGIGERDI